MGGTTIWVVSNRLKPVKERGNKTISVKLWSILNWLITSIKLIMGLLHYAIVAKLSNPYHSGWGLQCYHIQIPIFPPEQELWQSFHKLGYLINLSGNPPRCRPNTWKVVNMAHKKFSGTIPPNKYWINLLLVLKLNNNSLTGRLPSMLQFCRNFTVLDLDQFYGQINTR